jgi:hypothetical protein
VLNEHPSLTSITLRFLQSGHSFLPNDREFGDYEKLIQKQQSIELPSKYVELMRECHVTANKIEPIKMKTEKFISSDTLTRHVTNRKNTKEKGEKVNYLNTHQIKILKTAPSKAFFQYFPLDDKKVKK